ncbi:hypothetical protein SprV_0702422300 [Sparganum proliferum]
MHQRTCFRPKLETHVSQREMHALAARGVERDVPKCPRSDGEIILKNVTKYLVRQAFRASFEDLLLIGRTFMDFKIIIDNSIRFECTFLRDVSPASYMQFTCLSRIPTAKVYLTRHRNDWNEFNNPTNATGYFSVNLRDLALRATVDFTYWEKEDRPPNMIRLSSLELCTARTEGTICPYIFTDNMLLNFMRMTDRELYAYIKRGLLDAQPRECHQ